LLFVVVMSLRDAAVASANVVRRICSPRVILVLCAASLASNRIKKHKTRAKNRHKYPTKELRYSQVAVASWKDIGPIRWHDERLP
jgi:hypothetical protein